MTKMLEEENKIMEKIKSFVTDLAVCSMPMWFVGIMIVHWFVVGY